MNHEESQHSGVFATVNEPVDAVDGEAFPSTGLDITVLNMLPSDEVVYFVRRCAKQLEAREPSVRCTRVVVEKLASQSRRAGYRVTICADTARDALQMSHLDTDLYLAVRDAFDNAAVELSAAGVARQTG